MTFTPSRTGMVLHWVRALRAERPPKHAGHRMHLAINAPDGASTALALVLGGMDQAAASEFSSSIAGATGAVSEFDS